MLSVYPADGIESFAIRGRYVDVIHLIEVTLLQLLKLCPAAHGKICIISIYAAYEDISMTLILT